MTDNLFELSKSLGIPVEEVLEAFQGLKFKGFICTPAKSAKEFATGKYPVRFAGMPPQGLKGQSEVSLGAFAIERKAFERIKENLQDPTTFRVYLGYIRLAYEKTGGLLKDGYHFEAKEESLYQFLSMMDFWNTDKPVICEKFVWIIPNEKCKLAAEKMLGKKYAKNDYLWWNIRFDLGAEIKLTTPSDYPDEYRLVPFEMLEPWAKYLPTQILHVIIYLYSKMMTIDGKIKGFNNLNDVLEQIQEALDVNGKPKEDFPASYFDRELLIKELCDYNSLTYPVDATSTLEYLQQIGVIKVTQSKGSVDYILTDEIGNSKKILKTPKGWEDRMDKFVTSGSILFSYLNTDEIIKTE